MPLRYSVRHLALLDDAALRAAIEDEATKPTAGDLGQYAGEAARRLCERNPSLNGSRAAYGKRFRLRSFQLTWWAHAVAVGMLMLIAFEDAQYGRPAGRPLAVAILLLGSLVVARWLVSGAWRFAPPSAADNSSRT